MTHFLQTAAWARFQQALGRTIVVDSGNGWRYQAILEIGRFNKRLYCPYGPEVDSPAALGQALTSLKQQAKKHHATFIRIEPTGNITSKQLQKYPLQYVSYNQLQPEHTQIINLTPPEEDIIAAMHQNTRNLYRNYSKKGLSIRSSNNPKDVTIFTNLMHRVAARSGITPHSDTYFARQAEALFPTKDATLFYVTYENKPIAATIAFDDDTTRYYAHAAADDTYRKLSAGTALLVYVIIDAKRHGKQWFDLYGIAPNDDPAHKWAGFTRFKKSFGGTPKAYCGAWDYPISWFGYVLYRLFQQLAHIR